MRRISLGPVLLWGGFVVAAVGGLLPWDTARWGPQIFANDEVTVAFAGWQGPYGAGMLMAVVVGLVVLSIWQSPARRKPYMLLLLVLSGVAILALSIAGVVLQDAQELSRKASAEALDPGDYGLSQLEELKGLLAPKIGFGPGAFVASSGGIVVILGSLAARRGTQVGPRPKVLPAAPDRGRRECPHCKEPIRRDASVCPHCQRESEAWRFHAGFWWSKNDFGAWMYLNEATATWLPGPDAGSSTE